VASLSTITRVLAYRNTKIFYGGSFACWTGWWVQRIAVDWLSWQLTHSTAWVGIIAFCSLAPSVLISPFAGAIVDRVDRVHLTVVTQWITVAHALTLAALTYSGLIQIEVIAALEVVLGVSSTFAQPARQSLVPGMVPRSELPGAVALNSLTFNLSRSVGPGIGGIIVYNWGVVPAMLFNAATYFFASQTMLRLKLAPEHRRGHPPTASVLTDAIEGVAYVVRHPGMGPLVLFAFLVGAFARPVSETLAPYVDLLFHQGAGGLATLASVGGIAALAGGTLLAMRGGVRGMTRITLVAGFVIILATIAFISTGSFTVAIACSAVWGVAGTIHGIAAQTLLQTTTSGQMLGRVLSLWGMIGRAAPALGALAYGKFAEYFGLQPPVLVGCGIGLLGCLLVARRLKAIERSLER
jgi:MFS family permease